jgi:hypothetical protein
LATKPEKVYRAFVEAGAMAKWLPPNGFACTVHHLDAKIGGSLRMTFRNFTTGKSHSFGGQYLELVPGERVRYTESSRIPICPAKNLARTVLGMDVFRSAPYHDDEIYERVEALWAVLARSDLHSRAVQRLRHHSSATIRNWRR